MRVARQVTDRGRRGCWPWPKAQANYHIQPSGGPSATGARGRAARQRQFVRLEPSGRVVSETLRCFGRLLGPVRGRIAPARAQVFLRLSGRPRLLGRAAQPRSGACPARPAPAIFGRPHGGRGAGPLRPYQSWSASACVCPKSRAFEMGAQQASGPTGLWARAFGDGGAPAGRQSEQERQPWKHVRGPRWVAGPAGRP